MSIRTDDPLTNLVLRDALDEYSQQQWRELQKLEAYAEGDPDIRRMAKQGYRIRRQRAEELRAELLP